MKVGEIVFKSARVCVFATETKKGKHFTVSVKSDRYTNQWYDEPTKISLDPDELARLGVFLFKVKSRTLRGEDNLSEKCMLMNSKTLKADKVEWHFYKFEKKNDKNRK